MRSPWAKKIVEKNELGKRLTWLLNELNLSRSEVASDCKIPLPTFRTIEHGSRYGFYEGLYLLAEHLNTKYTESQKRLSYKGKPLERITLMWLMFGSDPILEEYEIKLKKLKEEHERQMLEYAQRMLELS